MEHVFVQAFTKSNSKVFSDARVLWMVFTELEVGFGRAYELSCLLEDGVKSRFVCRTEILDNQLLLTMVLSRAF